MNMVEGYIRTIADARDKLIKGGSTELDGDYPSMAHFVLAHGRDWERAAKLRPRGVKKGPKQQCYMNAFNLATGKPSEYAYVEGWAAGVFPVEHAWCVTKEGVVVDPTWDADIFVHECALGPNGQQYFGVAFSNRFVIRTAIERQIYGIIDNPEERWPLLQGEVPIEDWEHEWFATERCHREDQG
jgi:hypothetical protein